MSSAARDLSGRSGEPAPAAADFKRLLVPTANPQNPAGVADSTSSHGYDSAHTLNLLGFEHPFGADVPIGLLRDIGYAFEDLLDGKLTIDASATEVMPGSKPYRRR